MKPPQDGNLRISGPEPRAWGAPCGRTDRARGARLRRKQPNQNNPTTRCIRRSLGEGGRLAIMNLALRDLCAEPRFAGESNSPL